MITIYLKQYNKIIRNADTELFDDLGFDDILWIDMVRHSHLASNTSTRQFLRASTQIATTPTNI